MAFDRDEAVAAMADYHDRLAEAMSDPERFDAVFDEPPVGIGAHEIDAGGVIRRVNP